MIHLRVVAPADCAQQALELLCASDSVLNVVHLEGASRKPSGDVLLCDVAREDASVIVSDLKELRIHERGSIALEEIDSEISDAAKEAERSAQGLPSDAVVWEEVEQRTSSQTELSVSFVAFMVLAMQIASVGILLDQPILIVGAMVVGPEFGPLAGLSVALVELRGRLARRSLVALAVGFPVGVVLTVVGVLFFKLIGIAPADFTPDEHPLTEFITQPDAFSFIVAFLAGIVGVLSLTSTKSGALVGVLISVTTIPAAAGIGVGLAYGDPNEAAGAAAQLGLNLGAIVMAGVLTLFIQRRYFIARRRKHLVDPIREAAGLPMGRSARGTTEVPNWEELVKSRGGSDAEP